MKRIFFIIACLLTSVILNAQSLQEIVNKYTVANKLDKISSFKTIKITEKVSMDDIDIPTEIWMKNPNKIKIVESFNGLEIVQLFDGEEGFTIDPMTGSNDPVEMIPMTISWLQRKNIFQNTLDSLLRKGQISFAGEKNVNGKPAIILTANIEGGMVSNLFIDKVSYLLIKTSTDDYDGRNVVTMESYLSDYIETKGIMLPMKTTLFSNGIEYEVITVTKVEVDIPMEDSVFKVK